MESSGRGMDASAVSLAADAGRLYGVVEALFSSQQATHELLERNLQMLHESLLSNQRSMQEAFIASQRQDAASQALAIAACCVSAALFGMALLRARL